jgi:hypothetical protein
MKKKQKEELDRLRHAINEPKSRLIEILRQMEPLNRAAAWKLSRAISRLEAAQKG